MYFKRILVVIFFLFYVLSCISYESFLEKFSDQELLNKSSKNVDFNEVQNRQMQKDNLKRSYNTQRKLNSQGKKDCFELEKEYIENNYNKNKILNCANN